MKQTIAQILEERFKDAIRHALGIEADPQITPATNERFGDYQANVAMGLARTLASQGKGKANPREVAQTIVNRLELDDLAEKVEIAGPGFINVTLANEWVAQRLAQVYQDPFSGVVRAEQPETVVVDYSGPNIAKQMHVGHLRSTIIGDAISRLLELLGHHVIRQNHVGDWGTQFGMLIAYLKESNLPAEAHIEDLEEFYRAAKRRFDEDPQFQEQARLTVVRLQQGAPEERQLWARIVEETRRHYLPIYERLGVKLTVADERGESFYNDMLPDVVNELREKGLAVLSEGATVVFTEGHETPLIIQKSDGGYLYATTDLAAIRYRVQTLRASRIIYTHDSRQSQHFDQVFQVARKAGWAEGVKLEFAPFGTMLGEDGKPFKTRSGDTIKLKDLLDEAEERAYRLVTEKSPHLEESHRRSIARAVGIGGVKYSDLSKDRLSDYVFSWDKMLALDGNTAPYMQYAYARIRSIFRRGNVAAPPQAMFTLVTAEEIKLAKQLLRFPEAVESVNRELKPHLLCSYLFDTANRFTAFYEKCPVLNSDTAIRESRLALCELTARVIATGLDVLGIEHPDQM
ncbi:MAG: arginine--tRNA ligase [Candidatus Hydrogenedentota bacterium]|uniref:Arginine--tRNA ligase n=1 Tax=Sumerlaea chitinivorans TaxID=2250252 RepID=A0A2Z4Y3F8_SUMC1|nr:Arginyl-tRNA synthetase [Candidatus Sumerlaea chitinivorans]RMH28936.1 MAG: arginine--tRNA ligase [Candidatus Hydrogenedentota bacterium]GIX44641.1 MAG: arginine--tRNA ligase [Candidatus Sumerlaea sp.]